MAASTPMRMSAPEDTDPAVDALLIEGYRRMSPSQKLDRVRALTQAVQELALVDIRRRHPGATSGSRHPPSLCLIEPELMVRAFAWDVGKVGY